MRAIIHVVMASVVGFSAVWATGSNAEDGKPDVRWGSLRGRFLYAGLPPQPRRLELRAIGDAKAAQAEFRPADPFYLKQELYDESLLVDDDRGIANVVVWVRTKPLPIHPDDEQAAGAKVTIEVKDGRLVPHVVAMRSSQTLEVRNADPLSLNLSCDSLHRNAFNVFLKPGGTLAAPRLSDEPKPARLRAEVTPWIGGWLLVRDDRYFAISGKDGSFEIERVPVGRLEFTVWHERAGLLSTEQLPGGRFAIDVRPGVNEIRPIELQPQLLTAAEK